MDAIAAGEVVYFLSKWLHATRLILVLIYGCAMNESIFCYIIYSYNSALKPWSVGIGGQGAVQMSKIKIFRIYNNCKERPML